MGAEEDLTNRVPAGINMGISLIPSALGSLTTLRAPPSPACPLLQEIEVNTGALTTCQEEEKQFPMSTSTRNTALHTKGREVPEGAESCPEFQPRSATVCGHTGELGVGTEQRANIPSILPDQETEALRELML